MGKSNNKNENNKEAPKKRIEPTNSKIVKVGGTPLDGATKVDMTKVWEDIKKSEEESKKKYEKEVEKENKRIEKLECPCCKSKIKERHIQSSNNGIYGSGFHSTTIEDYYICSGCGVHFTDLNKKEIQNPSRSRMFKWYIMPRPKLKPIYFKNPSMFKVRRSAFRIERRRNYLNPFSSINLWLIPTIMYIIVKSTGTLLPDREFVWWIIIPTMLILWFFFNWKITKKYP